MVRNMPKLADGNLVGLRRNRPCCTPMQCTGEVRVYPIVRAVCRRELSTTNAEIPTARPTVSLLLSCTPHVEAILVKHQVGDLLIDLPEELYLSVYDF
jgi:hypothetical protein